MEKFIVIDKRKISLKNQFHSLCRNFNNFDNINDDDMEYAKEIANEIKDKYSNYSKDSIYYKYLEHILINYYNCDNKDIMPLILIMAIDPSLYIYKIYEDFSNFKDIKKRMKFIFGFDDYTIIKYEKEYIKKFLNLDDFNFIKKLEP